MDDALSFGRWLRRRRKGLDLTQAQLAVLVGYAEVTLRKIEADELRPSKPMAETLATHLEISPADRAAFVRFARDDRRADRLPVPSGIGGQVPRRRSHTSRTSRRSSPASSDESKRLPRSSAC
jgi:transcriptional regulator with XRE-family HTH domain